MWRTHLGPLPGRGKPPASSSNPKSARPLSRCQPLFLDTKRFNPVLEVLKIQRFALHLQNAGSVVDLTLGIADLRPFEFRQKNIREPVSIYGISFASSAAVT